LKRLKGINVGINKLTTIPESILNLPDLEKLVLISNKIKKLPQYILNSKIEVYYEWPSKPKIIEENDEHKIQEREPWSGIVLRENPLSNPSIEIVSQGLSAIREYFESAKDGMRPLHEVKLILVGDGGAGKTSLVKRLRDKEFNPIEKQTRGINIDSWQIKYSNYDVSARIWDFGGQEIMHSTHQFFLSERSIYLLVLDGRKEEDAEYWVKHVTAFGGSSPIIIILNKMDENPSFDLNRKFLQSKYNIIQGFHRISCQNGSGITELTKGIKEAINSIDIVKSMWPESWFLVKQQLESMGKPYIDYDEYAKVCEEAGVERENSKDTLVKYLHDLGVVVRFEDFELSNTHVLEPRWLTEAVYRIINSDVVAKNKGLLSLKDLKKILRKDEKSPFSYPQITHVYIIGLMLKFDLCYRIDEAQVLIPDLLSVQEPNFNIKIDNKFSFIISYDFLPKSVLARLIVLRQEIIYKSLQWRTGVVFKHQSDETYAVVRADYSEKKIRIEVYGKLRIDMLTIIRVTLFSINSRYEKVSFLEQVPLPDNPDVCVSYKHLCLLQESGSENYFPDGATRLYNVNELLGLVRASKSRTEDEFISILRGVITEKDNNESIISKANEIIMLQPNFAGLGINFNALLKRIFE
jgi:internalin A